MSIDSRRKDLIESLKDKSFRDEFVAAHLETGISFQIRANRVARGLTQSQLGGLSEMLQTAISRLESPEHGRPNIDTLLRLASAFDVALIVRFAPFSELVDWSLALGDTKLAIPKFSEDGRLAPSASSTPQTHSVRRATGAANYTRAPVVAAGGYFTQRSASK